MCPDAQGRGGTHPGTGADGVGRRVPQAPRRHVLSTPETQLLQALLVSPSLGERAASEVAPDSSGAAGAARDLPGAARHPDAASQFRASLTEAAQAIWSRLKESAAGVVGDEPAESYDRAAQILIARPEYRKMIAMKDAGERRHRRAELRRLYPEADRWYRMEEGQETRRMMNAR